MGAHSFDASVYAPDAKTGYDTLYEEAQYEEGHNAYNGTISTTSGFVMIPFAKGEGSSKWFERVIDKTEKWGPCACVEATHVEKNDLGHSLWHFAGWAAS